MALRSAVSVRWGEEKAGSESFPLHRNSGERAASGNLRRVKLFRPINWQGKGPPGPRFDCREIKYCIMCKGKGGKIAPFQSLQYYFSLFLTLDIRRARQQSFWNQTFDSRMKRHGKVVWLHSVDPVKKGKIDLRGEKGNCTFPNLLRELHRPPHCPPRTPHP